VSRSKASRNKVFRANAGRTKAACVASIKIEREIPILFTTITFSRRHFIRTMTTDIATDLLILRKETRSSLKVLNGC
jgi:hypothetical protein